MAAQRAVSFASWFASFQRENARPKAEHADEDQEEDGDDEGELGHGLTLVASNFEPFHRLPPPRGSPHDAGKAGLFRAAIF